MDMKTILIGLFILILASFVYSTTTVSLTSPADNTWIQTITPTITFNVSGNDSVFICNVYSNSTNVWAAHSTIHTAINKTNTNVIDTFVERNVSWNMRCNGSNNHSGLSYAASNYSLFIDTTNPSIVINNQSADDNFYNDDLNFTVNITATDANAALCNLYVNSTLNETKRYTTATPLQFRYNATSTANRTSYTWYVTCNDSSARSTTTSTRTVHMGGKPSVELNRPSDSAYVTSNTVWFNVTATGEVSSTYICYIYTNDTGNWTKEGGHTIATNGTDFNVSKVVSDGHVIWNTNCFEEGSRYPYVSNWNGANYSLIVDTSAPGITIHSPADNSYVNHSEGHSGQINLTVVDANTGSCILKINGTDNQTKTYTTNTPFTLDFNASDGDWDWNVWCNDSASLTNETANRTITVDTVYPAFRENTTVKMSTCATFGMVLNYTEEANTTMQYGLTSDSKTYTIRDSSFSSFPTLNFTFNNTYETLFYVNYSFCDRAKNCKTNYSAIQTPVGSCAGWSLWSIYRTINFSDVFVNSGSEYVYWWNKSTQSWLYYSAGTVTYGAYLLNLGDPVFLYNDTGTTWFRNNSGANTVKYRVNVTSGHNFFGLYHKYTFGNLSYKTFMNKTGHPDGNLTEEGFYFRMDYYNSFNNSNRTWVSNIFEWSWNNATKLGTYLNGLDVLHVYSDYNLTLNMTEAGSGFVYANWTG